VDRFVKEMSTCSLGFAGKCVGKLEDNLGTGDCPGFWCNGSGERCKGGCE